MLRKEVGEGGVPIFPERFDGKIAGIWNGGRREKERDVGQAGGRWFNVRRTDRHVGGTDRFVVSDTVAAERV